MEEPILDKHFGEGTTEGLSITVGLVLLAGTVFGVAMVPFAIVDEVKKDKHLESSYIELVQVLSEKEVEGILGVNGIENCIFNLNENKLTILADVDTEVKSDVTFAYEYQMTESLYDVLSNSPTVFGQYSTNNATKGSFSNSMKLEEILDEIVETSKGEISFTYECSQEQLDELNKVIIEFQNSKENKTTYTRK